MTTDECTCMPWKLRDPDAMLRAAAARVAFVAGRSYLVATDLGGRVTAVRRLPRAAEALTDSWVIARRFIEPAAQRMLGRSVSHPPDTVLHLVRCRNARAVWGRHEIDYAYGLLDGRNLLSAYCGEVIVVTPHGWTAGDRWGAFSPTLAELT